MYLHEMLRVVRSQYRVYDMSRGLRKVAISRFRDFELQKAPYPCPWTGKAMFALLCISRYNPDRPQLRCVQWELDAKHYVTRESLMGFEAEQAKRRFGKTPNTPFEEEYTWKPSFGDAYMLYAQAMSELKLPTPPEYLQVCEKLVSDRPQKTRLPKHVGDPFRWNEDIGLPELGLGYLLSRAEDPGNSELIKRLIDLPSDATFSSLCAFLTHAPLPAGLRPPLLSRMRDFVATLPDDASNLAVALYGLTQLQPDNDLVDLVEWILHRGRHNPEVLGNAIRFLRPVIAHPDFDRIALVDLLAAFDDINPEFLLTTLHDLATYPGLEWMIQAQSYGKYGPRARNMLVEGLMAGLTEQSPGRRHI